MELNKVCFARMIDYYQSLSWNIILSFDELIGSEIQK